ncbi:MAG: GNAT family N-acetyltransferase [Pseudomonadota bacterium]|nr:MAG: GNAT family N-acetyltransferase [Pseudomonadota bacterium]
MSLEIRTFRIEDYEQAFRLWSSTEGVALSDADSRDGIERFLVRNPELSFVALDAGSVVATLLCGHDGRRGWIHHLVVARAYRERGLARALVQRALASLRDAHIDKCHLLVFRDNDPGQAFWRRVGAQERVELKMFSLRVPNDDGTIER